MKSAKERYDDTCILRLFVCNSAARIISLNSITINEVSGILTQQRGKESILHV